MPYVLVAERSALSVLGLVVESLRKYAEPGAIWLIVPSRELEEFYARFESKCHVVAEEEIIPGWNVDRVAALLPVMPDRAGWYWQQFLKLAFGFYARVPQYVVWDADTVMLAKPMFWRGNQILMTPAKEYHNPYFDTFTRLTDRRPVLPASVISQYMLLETGMVKRMCAHIEEVQGRYWIEAILRCLPGTSGSEFSEYETYANYVESEYPGRIFLKRQKWFRYGSELLRIERSTQLRRVERVFRPYAYVSFERHRSRRTKTALAHLLCWLGVGS